MKHRLRKISQQLKSTGGFTYVEAIVTLLVVFISLALIVNVTAIGIDFAKTATFTNTLVDNAKTYGTAETNETDIDNLAREAGLDPSKLSFSWNAQYFDASTSKLAFEQPFTLTVTYACYLPLISSADNKSSFSVPIPYKGKGVSEVFWK